VELWHFVVDAHREFALWPGQDAPVGSLEREENLDKSCVPMNSTCGTQSPRQSTSAVVFVGN
jgi:hypothetical protein